jgi:hypothetical protein
MWSMVKNGKRNSFQLEMPVGVRLIDLSQFTMLPQGIQFGWENR